MLDSKLILTQLNEMLTGLSQTVYVGYSGGLDSTVLLHLTKQLDRDVRAIHVNHGLSQNSSHWQAHCQTVANTWGVPIQCVAVSVRADGSGTEAAAREARYEQFSNIIQKDEVLVLGHHLNDQVETLIFRLMRGTGLTGLTGIRSTRPLANGYLLRPLLAIAKEELLAYATMHKLQWIEDDSNDDERFDRNFLRHQIMPKLSERWPGFESRCRQTHQWLTEASDLLSEYAELDFSSVAHRQERLGTSICLVKFEAMTLARQKHLLRYWLKQNDGVMPDAAQLDQLTHVINADDDAAPLLTLGGIELRRFRKRLYLLPALTDVPLGSQIAIDSPEIILPDGSRFNLPESWSKKSLRLRFRQGGERCKPIERQHSQTLKKLLQEYALEPWLRDRVPLVYCGEELLAVGDLFRCTANTVDDTLEGEPTWSY